MKLVDWKTMNELVESQSFMFKFDIKQGYHHIDIYSKNQRFRCVQLYI